MSAAELVSRAVTIAGYLICVAVGVALVLASRRRPDVVAPAGRMLDRVMAHRGVRITLVLFWWWLGWHFLVTPPA